MKIRKIGIIISLALILNITALAADMPSEVVPGGHTIGIKVFTEGVLIIGTAPVLTAEGEKDPAGLAGLAKGDVITHIDDKPILSAKDMQGAVRNSGGREMLLRIRREGKTEEMRAEAVKSSNDGELKLGVWIRDSMAGIGTITFYEPDTKLFGALGHGVNDSETGGLLEISSGQIVHSVVVDVTPGQSGAPGELRGQFDSSVDGGSLLNNTNNGVFGVLREKSVLGEEAKKPMPVGAPEELKTGKATILSNVRGNEIEEFDIEITRIISENGSAKNFMLKVTDERLIGITGGIVQGMSGSPVLQNGKIMGAVTHVLVNDPKRGYGVFIHSMINDGLNSLKRNDKAA